MLDILSAIVNAVSAGLNLKASQDNKALNSALRRSNTNLRIAENNKMIKDGDIMAIADRLHQYNTLEETEDEFEDNSLDEVDDSEYLEEGDEE